MKEKFLAIDYLETGNIKQKKAHKILKNIQIFNILEKFNPILVGTIPIRIDLESSDLDIICEVYNIEEFETIIKENFSNFNQFNINKINNEILTANFIVDNLEIEVYAENLKSTNQNGYRHMIIENRILSLGGEQVRQRVIKLKENGLKTEPAFAKFLCLKGDPYIELLKLEKLSDYEIRKLIKAQFEIIIFNRNLND